jgi:hypothetical protein
VRFGAGGLAGFKSPDKIGGFGGKLNQSRNAPVDRKPPRKALAPFRLLWPGSPGAPACLAVPYPPYFFKYEA